MAKKESIPAQTSKDAQKDPLAATEMILLVATPGGDSQILDARRPGTCRLSRIAPPGIRSQPDLRCRR
jgi:hypothetical protein